MAHYAASTHKKRSCQVLCQASKVHRGRHYCTHGVTLLLDKKTWTLTQQQASRVAAVFKLSAAQGAHRKFMLAECDTALQDALPEADAVWCQQLIQCRHVGTASDGRPPAAGVVIEELHLLQAVKVVPEQYRAVRGQYRGSVEASTGRATEARKSTVFGVTECVGSIAYHSQGRTECGNKHKGIQ